MNYIGLNACVLYIVEYKEAKQISIVIVYFFYSISKRLLVIGESNLNNWTWRSGIITLHSAKSATERLKIPEASKWNWSLTTSSGYGGELSSLQQSVGQGRSLRRTASCWLQQVHGEETLYEICSYIPFLFADNSKKGEDPKHIAVQYHHFRQYITKKAIQVEKIATQFQRADIFTKALPRDTFRYFRNLIIGW